MGQLFVVLRTESLKEYFTGDTFVFPYHVDYRFLNFQTVHVAISFLCNFVEADFITGKSTGKPYRKRKTCLLLVDVCFENDDIIPIFNNKNSVNGIFFTLMDDVAFFRIRWNIFLESRNGSVRVLIT